MPRYEISSPDGRKFEVTAPEGASQAEVLAYAQANFGSAAPVSAGFSGSDIATAFKSGAVGATKALADVAGAENIASQALGTAGKEIQAQYSPARQAELQAQAARMKQAEASGSIFEEIKAGARSIAEAPLQTIAQGVGSFVPYVPAMLLGPVGAALGLGAKTVAALGTVANAAPRVMGTAQGIGAVKGSIYDTVYEKEREAGLSEAEARAKAAAAQEYTGKNIDQMALAGLLGYVAGSSGVERLLTPKGAAGAAPGMARRVGRAALEESLTEAPQGGQERLAANLALQREGYDVPTFQGVAGQATQEGLTGALSAGPIAAFRGPAAEVPPAGVPGAPGEPPAIEAAAQARRLQLQEEQRLAAQGVASREGEKILGAEAAQEAKLAKEQEKAAQQTMQDEYTRLRAEREAELKEAFPADYSDVMERTDRYGVLATELASLEPVRKTADVRERIQTIKQRMAEITAEDDRVPNELRRMYNDQLAAARAAKFPAEKAAAVFAGTAPAQIEMREALPEGPLPPQLDLFGNPIQPTTPQPEGLADVISAGLPATTDVLDAAGIAPTRRELEAAGQQKLGLRKTPTGQPTSPVRAAAPAKPIAPLPVVEAAPAQPAQPGAITATEVRQFGTMSKANRQWLVDNIEGRTPEQVRDMVEADPAIMTSVPKGLQAVLKEIVAVAAPKEPPSVQPPSTVPTSTEPTLRARRGKPSVGVPSQPAGAELAEPGMAAAPSAGEPAPAVGRGLVPAGQPTGPRDALEVEGQPALDEEAQRKAEADKVAAALAKVAKEAQAPRSAEPTATFTPSTKAKKPKVEPEVKLPTGSPFDILAKYKARKAAEAPAKKPAKAEKLADRLGLPQGPARENAKNEAIPLEDATLLKKMIVKTVDAGLASGKTRQQIVDQLDALTRGGITPADFNRINEYLTEKGVKEEAPAKEEAKAEAPKPKRIRKAKTPQEATQVLVEDPAAVQEVKELLGDAPAVATAPAVEETKSHPEWATTFESGANAKVVYSDDEVALLRGYSAFTGQYVYVGISKAANARANNDISAYTGKLFSAEQKARLMQAKDQAVAQESTKAAQNPDGPFANAASNVVGSEGVSSKYTGYLADLMKSLGLGDIKVFLLHPDDLKADGADAKYSLYGEYASAKSAGIDAGEDGSVRPYGPKRNAFYISMRPGMSEGRTLETLAHELGHIIEKVALANAPAETKAAIKAEHEAWVKATKGKQAKEIIESLRNRETAEAHMMSVPDSKSGAELSPYWTSFAEWFADNTSKWATTSEKPVGIVEKFFANVAQKMRDLVAVVTGRKFPPAKSVADFLDAMGPDSAAAWLASKEPVSPAAQQSTSKTAAKILGVDELDTATQAAISEIQAAMPKLDAEAQNNVIEQGLKGVADARKKSGIFTTFRQAAVDKFSTVESKVSQMFSKGVRDSFGNLNPMVLARQAEDSARLVLDFYRTGGIELTKDGIVSTRQEKQSMASALEKVAALGQASNMTYDKAKEYVSTVLEGHRLAGIRDYNNTLEQEAVSLEALGKNSAADEKRSEKIVMHMTNAEINTLEAIYQKSKAIQSIQDDLNATRTQAIDFMISTGRISAEQGGFWKDNTAYVPFSRVFEDTPTSKVRRGQGMAVLRNIPEMKGSLGRPVQNVLDAYANRLGYMVEESVKNHASVHLLSTMELGGYAKKLRGLEQATNKNLVVPKLYIDGKPVLFEVQNEYDLLAFQQAPEITNWLVKGLASMARVLRTSVTAMPPFALKQVIDDAQRAMFTSGVKRPLVVGMKTLHNLPRTFFGELTGRKSPLVRQLEAAGVIGDFDSNVFQPTNDLEIEIGAKKRGVGGKVLHRLEQFTKASDLSARLAVYEETLLETGGKRQDDGDITGGDRVLAQTRARELINFSRRGSSSSMRMAAQVIPFFNAYAQGMDVLYRAASGIDSTSSVERSAARKMFWSRVALMSAMGMVYALAMSDDEGYKNASEDVRDNNWLLPDGMKLPVPRELGFIFKSIPERVVEYYQRYGTAEEQSALKALGGVVKAAFSAYGSPNAIPSVIRPVLENMTNYSFFAQRELEPKSVQGQEPGFRSTSATSELAKALGESTNISPIKIDNLIRGMFGMMGSTTLMATDAIINPTRPDRPLYQLPFASIFLYDTIGGKAKTEFYDLREKIAAAVTTYNDLETKDPAKAEAYGEKNAALLSAAPTVNEYLRQLNDLSRLRRLLEQGTEEALGMTGAERRAEIDEIRRAENEVVSFVREMDADLRKP